MFNFFSLHFSRGVTLARNNPQILYTVFLLIAIPLAFFASSQRFLDASREHQDRIERESIGLLQDTFASFASENMDDPVFLDHTIRMIKSQNDSMKEFVVVEDMGGGTMKIVASLDSQEVGKDLDPVNKKIYEDLGGAMKKGSVALPLIVNGDRHWRGYRAIVDVFGNTKGFILTDMSMKHLDDFASESLLSAYLFMICIVFVIFVLLVRQARIVDYTVLYRRLKEVDQMKDDFVSMAAHELRTPLAIIRGYVDLLKDIKNIEEKDKENLARIDMSAQKLNVLIGDILDVSRLEQGRMKFEFSDISVHSVVETVTESFQTLAKGKGLALSFLGDGNIPKISGDSERLRQVLTNIIGNAVKYTPSGSVTVRVSFELLKKKVYIRVSDTGLGISAEDQKRLFEKFFRVKSAETENITGTGLGLWITRQIILSMKGDIAVESIKGKGTDFVISFPALELDK